MPGLVGQQHAEQLCRVTDPFAQHPEVASPDSVAIDQGHPLQEPGPVAHHVQGRIGHRVVEGHAVDGGHPDGPGHIHDRGACPVGDRVVVADARQTQVRGVVGEAEDEGA